MDALGGGSGEVLADKICADRQLSVSPIDEHRQLHSPRPPEVAEGL